MFKAKSTTRRVKRATSPLPNIPPSPLVNAADQSDISGSVPDLSGAGGSVSAVSVLANVITDNLVIPTANKLSNFFEAESFAATNTRPWLRLERGIRLQKLRAFAESYPGLTAPEKENLNKMLVKANDSKLLNTKQQIIYENGKILNIRGLKTIRDGDPTHSATFKIEIHRQTKKRNNDAI